MKNSEILKNSETWSRWARIDASDDITELAPSMKAREKLLWDVDHAWSEDVLNKLIKIKAIDMNVLDLLINEDGQFYDFVDDVNMDISDRNLRQLIRLKDSSWSFLMPYLTNIINSIPNSQRLKKMFSNKMGEDEKVIMMANRISGRWNLHYDVPLFYYDVLKMFTEKHFRQCLSDWKMFVEEFGASNGVLLALYAHRAGKSSFNTDEIFNYAHEHHLWDRLSDENIKFVANMGLYFNDPRYPLDAILERSLSIDFVQTIQNFSVFFHSKTVDYLLKHGHEENYFTAFSRAYAHHTGKDLTDMSLCKYIAEQGGYVLKEVRTRWKAANQVVAMGIATSPFPLALSHAVAPEISLILE